MLNNHEIAEVIEINKDSNVGDVVKYLSNNEIEDSKILSVSEFELKFMIANEDSKYVQIVCLSKYSGYNSIDVNKDVISMMM